MMPLFIITIKNALAAGGLVCMHVDRYMSGMRTLKSTFLGRAAHFFCSFFMEVS
jgi:predicted LPLAT superfamily acyltransferase